MQQNSRKQLFRQKAMDKAFTAEDLDKTMQVTRPTGWLALLVMGVIILAAVVWSITGNLSIKVATGGVILDNSGAGQQAVLFLPLVKQESVRPGMKVQMTLSGFPPQQYGYLLGTVGSVSQYPLTAQNMADILKNDALAAIFSQSGPDIMVTVDLIPKDGAKDYTWTTGRSTQVSSGTLLQAGIIVDEKRPIALLLPN
jgi:HlyD family secretion protein